MPQEIQKHKPFPTIIVDDFFEEPNKVLELANSLEYTDAADYDYKWPGKRSTLIHEVDYNFFNNIVVKVLSTYYPYAKVSYNDTRLLFQKVASIYEDGWIHKDDNLITFIIYLNNTKITDAGTSICIPKNSIIDNIIIHTDKKQESFKDPNKVKEYEPYRLENNNQFEEVIRVNNVFNRCIMFNASSYHKANGFNTIDNSEDRLTLIGFIHDFTFEY
jgi:hypothetical protein